MDFASNEKQRRVDAFFDARVSSSVGFIGKLGEQLMEGGGDTKALFLSTFLKVIERT